LTINTKSLIYPVNDDALEGFKSYARHFAPSTENIALYSLHNVHMKMNCAQMAGSYTIAMSAANELQKQIPDFYLSIPVALGNYIQYLYQSPLFTQVLPVLRCSLLKRGAEFFVSSRC